MVFPFESQVSCISKPFRVLKRLLIGRPLVATGAGTLSRAVSIPVVLGFLSLPQHVCVTAGHLPSAPRAPLVPKLGSVFQTLSDFQLHLSSRIPGCFRICFPPHTSCTSRSLFSACGRLTPAHETPVFCIEENRGRKRWWLLSE